MGVAKKPCNRNILDLLEIPNNMLKQLLSYKCHKCNSNACVGPNNNRHTKVVTGQRVACNDCKYKCFRRGCNKPLPIKCHNLITKGHLFMCPDCLKRPRR